jgi:hypothetical protein
MAFAKGSIYAVNERLNALERFATEQDKENRFLRAELKRLEAEYALVLKAAGKAEDYIAHLRKRVAERLVERTV